MSIYNLVQRNVKFSQANERPPKFTAYSASERTPPTQKLEIVDTKPTGNALSALSGYIPSETITLYIAALAIAPSVSKDIPWFNQEFIYWMGFIVTPIFAMLVFVTIRRNNGLSSIPPNLSSWPLWAIFSSTLAFAVWGLAVPGAPFINSDGLKAFSGFMALFVSIVLETVGHSIGAVKQK